MNSKLQGQTQGLEEQMPKVGTQNYQNLFKGTSVEGRWKNGKTDTPKWFLKIEKLIKRIYIYNLNYASGKNHHLLTY